MTGHTFPVEKADRLEDIGRYRYLSRDELVALLDPDPGALVADFGSGTGFYTDEIVPYVDEILAIDMQPEMHEFYRDKGVPDRATQVLATVDALPFPDNTIDIGMTVMTFHEIATERAIGEIARVIRPGGRFVVVDWSPAGHGEAGPGLDERISLERARTLCTGQGFTVRSSSLRPETFVLVCEAG